MIHYSTMGPYIFNIKNNSLFMNQGHVVMECCCCITVVLLSAAVVQLFRGSM